MKDQNSTKSAKKAQKKVIKKDHAKSLKDPLLNHKKQQHNQRFEKPDGKAVSNDKNDKKQYFKKRNAKSKSETDDLNNGKRKLEQQSEPAAKVKFSKSDSEHYKSSVNKPKWVKKAMEMLTMASTKGSSSSNR